MMLEPMKEKGTDRLEMNRKETERKKRKREKKIVSKAPQSIFVFQKMAVMWLCEMGAKIKLCSHNVVL